jgi:hypothetical protein
MRRSGRILGALVAGALGAVGLLGIMTIGLPLIALAGGLVVLLFRAGLREREVAFVFLGATIAFAAFGMAAFPYEPCREGEVLVDPPGPGQRNECGGTNPAIYLVPAVLALMSGVIVARNTASVRSGA